MQCRSETKGEVKELAVGVSLESDEGSGLELKYIKKECV